MENNFYVYTHDKFANGKWIPFYVGKGKGARFKVGKRNKWHASIVKKYETRATVWCSNLDEQAAFDGEKELISFLKEDGFVLTNMSDGGEGQSGYRFSEEHKENHPSKRQDARLRASEKSKLQFSKEGAKDHLLGDNNPARRQHVREKMKESTAKAIAEGRHNCVASPPLRTLSGKIAVRKSHQHRIEDGTHHLLLDNPAKTEAFKEARRNEWLSDKNPMRNPEIVAKRINPSSIPSIAKARGLKLKGRVCVNDGKRYVRVQKDDVENWLAKGWKKGRI